MYNLSTLKSSQTSSFTSLIVVSSGVSHSSCLHQGKAHKFGICRFLLLLINKTLHSFIIIQTQTLIFTKKN
ncbi:MAG: hypothetical protein LBC61_03335 [Candidatus Peribacteria bacterium]|nr:hypothetical protein [Candidatus Peribacteria bacterium]